MALGTALVTLATILGGWPVSAHHSISSIYDGSRSATVEGRVTEFRFVHPHPTVVIEVEPDGEGGVAESWRLEMDNRFELVAVGMSADTLRPGDYVIVTGSPDRTQPRRLYVQRLDRPSDGLRYEQIGTRPRLRLPPR